jgi:hypothetical protein
MATAHVEFRRALRMNIAQKGYGRGDPMASVLERARHAITCTSTQDRTHAYRQLAVSSRKRMTRNPLTSQVATGVA